MTSPLLPLHTNHTIPYHTYHHHTTFSLQRIPTPYHHQYFKVLTHHHCCPHTLLSSPPSTLPLVVVTSSSTCTRTSTSSTSSTPVVVVVVLVPTVSAILNCFFRREMTVRKEKMRMDSRSGRRSGSRGSGGVFVHHTARRSSSNSSRSR